jgi:hypothetical protein
LKGQGWAGAGPKASDSDSGKSGGGNSGSGGSGGGGGGGDGWSGFELLECGRGPDGQGWPGQLPAGAGPKASVSNDGGEAGGEGGPRLAGPLLAGRESSPSPPVYVSNLLLTVMQPVAYGNALRAERAHGEGVWGGWGGWVGG